MLAISCQADEVGNLYSGNPLSHKVGCSSTASINFNMFSELQSLCTRGLFCFFFFLASSDAVQQHRFQTIPYHFPLFKLKSTTLELKKNQLELNKKLTWLPQMLKLNSKIWTQIWHLNTFETCLMFKCPSGFKSVIISMTAFKLSEKSVHTIWTCHVQTYDHDVFKCDQTPCVHTFEHKNLMFRRYEHF